ncbi:putative NUT family member 2E-like [Sciurus carolinensis]|uniref:NUT family member 2E-like n=1 Tax=Sciurus carolinensis TaxID=30640 RepID=A0AA41NEQ2_SCICA|nr:putative NUT family member 2E-like [Sciurus carolinensis]
MSKKRALTGCSYSVEKMSCSGPPLQVTGRQHLDLELVQTCQPQKRKFNASGNQQKKKRT